MSEDGIPEGWSEATIDEILGMLDDGKTLHQGWSPRCETISSQPTQWGVLKTTAIQDGEFQPEHNKLLPDKLQPKPKLEVKSGDLLITCAGPRVRCGVACLVRETEPKLMISGKMYRFRTPEGIEPEFLEALLRSPEMQTALDGIKTGIDESGLNLTHQRFRSLSVKIAPTKEQRRIVAKIEALQERSWKAREALSDVGPLLEQFRQSLLAAAFRGDLTADWRAKNPDVEPASQLLDRIRQERRECWEQAELAKYQAKGKKPPKGWNEKYQEPEPVDDSELPKLPEGWCWVTIDSISDRVSDGVHKKPAYVDDGIPFLTVKNLTASPAISFEKTRYVTKEDHEEFIRRTHPEKGDILVTKDGTLGVVRLIETDTVFSIFVSLALIKTTLKEVSPFIAKMLEAPQGQAGMKATGSGLQHIHLVDLRATIVPLAPQSEQNEIVRLINQTLESHKAFSSITQSSESNLAVLDQSILAKAFRGELVPQDPSDKPASVLLDRIRKQREAAGQKSKKPARQKRAERPTKTLPKVTTPPSVTQCVLLLLKAWGKPVPFPILEAGVRLMLEPELQDTIIKPRRGRRKASSDAVPLFTGMDQIYQSLVSKSAISLVGKHAYELNVDNESILKLLDESSLPMAESAIAALEAMMQRRKLNEDEAGMAVAQMVSQPYVATTNV